MLMLPSAAAMRVRATRPPPEMLTFSHVYWLRLPWR